MTGFGGSLLLAIVICLSAHLSVDKDFAPAVKRGAMCAIVIFVIIYILLVVF